jgi:1,2-diacylglycerol 3-beta-galactosyltransferase
MSTTLPRANPAGRRVVPPAARVLLLTADTGGGHRAAAEALREEFAPRSGDPVTTVLLDPMTGPAAPRLVAGLARLYGPLVRHAPWLWGALFHSTDAAPVCRVLTSLVTRALRRTLAEAVRRHDPDVVVVLHPLLVAPAVAARRGARVVTLVTDLGRPHRSWWHPGADHVVGPPAVPVPGGAGYPFGVPVRRAFTDPRLRAGRDGARRHLGLAEGRFVVLVAGGAEGARGTERWARALAAGPADVDVMVVCGRNARLRRRLARVAAPPGRRMIVTGFVDDMATRLGAVDLLVTKAGPGIIAEAAAVGLPLLVAGHLPGQEAGNREHVVRAGAGLAVDSTRDLVAAVRRLQLEPDLLHRLREGALRAGRPHAAAMTADLIRTLTKETR